MTSARRTNCAEAFEYRFVWNGERRLAVRWSDHLELLKHADRCAELLELELDAPLRESSASPLDFRKATC